jgi:putative two-component system response regulator
MLRGSGSGLLDLAAVIAKTHHEKFDGSGYPCGLAGTDIPLEGRIVAVADVFDALTSDRVYRQAWSLETTIAWMTRERGRHFDPEVLDVFLDSMDEIRSVQSLLSHD